jgi:hypothetical protein
MTVFSSSILNESISFNQAYIHIRRINLYPIRSLNSSFLSLPRRIPPISKNRLSRNPRPLRAQKPDNWRNITRQRQPTAHGIRFVEFDGFGGFLGVEECCGGNSVRYFRFCVYIVEGLRWVLLTRIHRSWTDGVDADSLGG